MITVQYILKSSFGELTEWSLANCVLDVFFLFFCFFLWYLVSKKRLVALHIVSSVTKFGHAFRVNITFAYTWVHVCIMNILIDLCRNLPLNTQQGKMLRFLTMTYFGKTKDNGLSWVACYQWILEIELQRE